MIPALGFALILILSRGEPTASSQASRLRVAATTSTVDSGLMEWLVPPFQQETGLEVEIITAGTGQALALGERGDVDLVLVHDRRREDAFMAAGWGSERRTVMSNHFVLAGPREDPAGIRGSLTAASALARIAAQQASFVSRGDGSGTHRREQELWKQAGHPAPERDWYLESGQGMGASLMIAEQHRAYLLTDRGTLLAFAHRVSLDIMVQGEAALENPYGALKVNAARHPHVNGDGAARFLDYLVSPAGRQRIASFQVHGRQIFQPAETPL